MKSPRNTLEVSDAEGLISNQIKHTIDSITILHKNVERLLKEMDRKGISELSFFDALFMRLNRVKLA